MSLGLFDEIDKYTPKKIRKVGYDLGDSKKGSLFDSNYDYLQWHSVILSLFVLFIFFVFIAKALSIQVTNKDYYVDLANKNRLREFSILSGRGVIYDRNGEVLVRNKPSFSVEINTLICESQCGAVIEKIKSFIPLDDEETVALQLANRVTNILLAAGLPKDTILPLEANLSDMPGVYIEAAPSRDYLFKDIFSHLIGYVGQGKTLTPSIVGKTGVEDFYNNQLSGSSGKKVVEVDSFGTSYKLITIKEPNSGKNITLNVDLGLQSRAFNLLKETVDDPENNTSAGVVVAQDPMNGGILALVSYPGFDPNSLTSGISKADLQKLNSDPKFPFYNRAISAAYPPGSTFKLVTASAVLMEKIADEFLSIVDKGYIQVGSFIFRNWNTGGHGVVDLQRALQVSNDTYFYTVGGGYGGIKGLGIAKLYIWADKFGYGKKTGIDLNGEISGFMPDGTHREWYLGDDYISAIGQGDILATPLQVNNMMTYFANGGRLYRPSVVREIEGDGTIPNEMIAKDIIDSKSYDLIRAGIHKAVLAGGTGYPLFDFSIRHPGVELAGKTGTSEYIDSSGKLKTHAWFTAFGPYFPNINQQAQLSLKDRPIVLTVFLEGGGSGSDDAAPISKELLDYWFER